MTLQQILESTCQLVEQNEQHLKAKIKRCIKRSGLNVNEIEGLDNLLESQDKDQDVVESMKQLKTSKDRKKYLKNTFNMVVSIYSFSIFY